MTANRQRTDNTTHHIVDKSGDPDFYVRFPKIAWALARDTYDYTFYGVVKDIAGDSGECWLATEDLATLCMMSAGKIADCRDYWLSTGLVQGELVQVGELKSLWHLSIKNIWEENRQWARAHLSIDARLEYKAGQGKAKPKTEIQKTCKRCGVTFIASGRRTRRCPECQAHAEQEQKLVWEQIHQPAKRYIKPEDFCVMCEGREELELHLNFDTKKLSVICANCHDLLHKEVHSMNFLKTDDGSSWHELPLTPDELPAAPHELPPGGSSWHEPKNNHLKNNQMNTQKKPDMDQTWSFLLSEISKELRLADYNTWVVSAVPIKVEENVLHVGTANQFGVEWLRNHAEIFCRCLEKINPGLGVTFEVIGL